MKNILVYVARNWYYGVLIVAAFFVINAYWPAHIQSGALSWYIWGPTILGIFVIGYFVWGNAREHQIPYVRKEVLDTIVHEFQTPISAIKMAADILQTPFGRSSPERMDKYVQMIREETERLQQQVDVMLSLARADSNRLSLCLDTVDLNNLLQSIAERHGEYLELRLLATKPLLVADRLHLTNVLHNLLDNAVKYSVSDPELKIHTEFDKSGLVIAVTDHGMGIPKHLQRKVFQPFFRVSEADQVSVKGFGLGLSYVQRIIEAHDWRIELVSEVGRGSEFKIRIPLRSLANPEPVGVSTIA
ncbi:HAMP domain-containing histidine kinase [Fibrella sp. HMF5335]|uniref:histidine kinase n=1 Tax=Fibrella rubiginis TaxID=2817060 RepID=A0A939GDW3_9BACT|nr:HAMP domain-containing sensor histidine kinase [Fibrella rubiginis]MBO0935040.1 HAMP domain-containing histidine kinase [Fibrella rubiginis]